MLLLVQFDGPTNTIGMLCLNDLINCMKSLFASPLLEDGDHPIPYSLLGTLQHYNHQYKYNMGCGKLKDESLRPGRLPRGLYKKNTESKID